MTYLIGKPAQRLWDTGPLICPHKVFYKQWGHQTTKYRNSMICLFCLELLFLLILNRWEVNVKIGIVCVHRQILYLRKEVKADSDFGEHILLSGRALWNCCELIQKPLRMRFQRKLHKEVSAEISFEVFLNKFLSIQTPKVRYAHKVKPIFFTSFPETGKFAHYNPDFLNVYSTIWN